MSEPEPKSGTAAGRLSDVKPRTIALFGLILIAMVVASVIVSVWLFDLFAARQTRAPVPPPVARQEPPAGPRLQVNAPGDLAQLRGQEEAILSSYGWVDRGTGIVRIPIDQAMGLLLERGLSGSRKDAGQQAPAGKAPRK